MPPFLRNVNSSKKHISFVQQDLFLCRDAYIFIFVSTSHLSVPPNGLLIHAILSDQHCVCLLNNLEYKKKDHALTKITHRLP